MRAETLVSTKKVGGYRKHSKEITFRWHLKHLLLLQALMIMKKQCTVHCVDLPAPDNHWQRRQQQLTLQSLPE